jgi:hypothetical protein
MKKILGILAIVGIGAVIYHQYKEMCKTKNNIKLN